MAIDPDEILWIHLDYALEDLEVEARRLSEPERAYDRWMQVTVALLLAGAGARLDPVDLGALAARITVVELRSWRYR